MTVGAEDVWWLSIALGFGFAARQVRLPPMIGFLLAGFVNNGLGMPIPDSVVQWGDFGLTLMLFCIGLKLNPGQLIAPRVWGVALLHMLISMLFLGGCIAVFVAAKFSYFGNLNLTGAAILTFSLTFSSTVFAIKTLEEAGELASAHGKLSVGVLVMQDIAAVVFLAISKGVTPSPWAVIVFLLIPARGILKWFLEQCGHGELLVVFGFVLALGGAALFEMVQLKGDLGSLILGSLLASHPKAAELKHHLVDFQDLFLVGFFLTVGAQGLTYEAAGLGVVLVFLLPIKGVAWQLLFMSVKMRPRVAFTTTTSLFSYSEFALIVVAYAVKLQLVPGECLSMVAIALTCSFVVSSVCDDKKLVIFEKLERHFQRCDRTMKPPPIVLDDDKPSIVVVGLGKIGQSVHDAMKERHGVEIIAIDFDVEVVNSFKDEPSYKVLFGDASEPEVWHRFPTGGIFLLLITLSKLHETEKVIQALKLVGYDGAVAIVYHDMLQGELTDFKNTTGIELCYDITTEAGLGFVEHVCENIVWPETVADDIKRHELARRDYINTRRRSMANPHLLSPSPNGSAAASQNGDGERDHDFFPYDRYSTEPHTQPLRDREPSDPDRYGKRRSNPLSVPLTRGELQIELVDYKRNDQLEKKELFTIRDDSLMRDELGDGGGDGEQTLPTLMRKMSNEIKESKEEDSEPTDPIVKTEDKDTDPIVKTEDTDPIVKTEDKEEEAKSEPMFDEPEEESPLV